MGRKKTPRRIRELEIAGTKLLITAITAHSGKLPRELEEVFGVGSEGSKHKRCGGQWRRYGRGRQSLPQEKRGSVGFGALRRDWLPDDLLPMYLDELLAFGPLREILIRKMCGEPISAAGVAAHQAQWVAWFRARKETKERECVLLRRYVARLERAATDLQDFLQKIDSSGHDHWSVDLPDRDVQVDDLGNIETISGETDYLAQLREIVRLTHTIELQVLDEFAADMIPPKSL